MKDAEIIEALYGLAGHHGGAIVRHQGAGKPSLHDGLTEAMDETLGGLIPIPLEVTDQPRSIIQDPEEFGRHPFARAVEDLP